MPSIIAKSQINTHVDIVFVEPRPTRTLVPEVVAAIEARRKEQMKRKPAPKRSRLPRPRRKVIYDDFGEPLRRVWIEE